jgi:Spy/CpxP family protein refolding chaperone
MNVFSKQRLIGWVIVLLVLLNMISLGTLWFFQIRKPSSSQELGPDPVRHFLEQELDLTAEQAQEFEALRREHLELSKAINDEANNLKRALMNEVFAASPDAAKGAQLAEQIGEKRTELEQLRFQHFLALKSLCQPEQVELLQALIHEIVRPPAPPESERPSDPRRPPGQGQPPAGSSPQGPPGQGMPEGPQARPVPQEAIAACVGKNEQEACQFKAPHGNVNGTCRRNQNQLVCIPGSPQPDR